MKELLSQIAVVFKGVFTEWFPAYINADLGPIGIITTAIPILLLAFGLIRLILKRGR